MTAWALILTSTLTLSLLREILSMEYVSTDLRYCATGEPYFLIEIRQNNSWSMVTLFFFILGKQDDVDYAVEKAKEAQVKWAALSPHVRARHMYAIARAVQKHARLISVIEALDNGKPIRETRDADIPLVARHFYHHAGWAQLMEEGIHRPDQF